MGTSVKLLDRKNIVFVLLICSMFALFAIDVPDISQVKSFESLKFTGVHEQGADRSCGLSVLSSILNLYLGHNTDENTLIRQFQVLLQENEELSMQQIMNIFSAYGYLSKTYRADVANLIKAVDLYAPVIVHYKKPDLHFAIVLYADDKCFVTADPVSGIEINDISSFEKRWSNIMLLIKMPKDKLNKNLLNDTVKRAIEKAELMERRARHVW